MSLYLKFEEKYRQILLLREEEVRILVDDIADEKAKLATVKLQKKNDLELQIKTQTSAAVEDEFAHCKNDTRRLSSRTTREGTKCPASTTDEGPE